MSNVKAYQAAYRKANAEKRKAYSKAYYRAKREEMRAESARRYAKNRKKILAGYRKNYQQNPEKYRTKSLASYYANPKKSKLRLAAQFQKHKKKWEATNTKWRKDNPEIIAAISKRRADRLRANGGSHTRAERKAKFAEYGNRCFYCNTGGRLETDHDIPVARGGTSDISNILPTCKACNVRKHTMTTDEYILWRST